MNNIRGKHVTGEQHVCGRVGFTTSTRCMTTFLFLFRDLKIRDAGRRPSSGAAAAGAENAITSRGVKCVRVGGRRTNCVREIDWFMFMLLHGYD